MQILYILFSLIMYSVCVFLIHFFILFIGIALSHACMYVYCQRQVIDDFLSINIELKKTIHMVQDIRHLNQISNSNLFILLN